MDFLDKHPAELDFHKMLNEVKSLLEKMENTYLDEHEKEVLKVELKDIKQRLFDFQMERFANYINDRGKVENMPAEEENLQREMTDLIIKISDYLNSE